MSKQNKKLLAVMALSLVILGYSGFLIPAQAHASLGSVLSGQICVPDNSTTGSARNLGRCINNIYIFAISIGSFIAVLMFVIAGYYYIIGSTEAVKQGNSILGSTLLGLVILFGTYILLNTIDPNLTKIQPISAPDINCDSGGAWDSPTNCSALGEINPNIKNPFGPNNSGQTIAVPSNYKPVGNINITSCVNCVNASDVGIPIKTGTNSSGNPVTNPYLEANLASALSGLEQVNNTWRITEAWPPTVAHQSACHYNGTCVDIALNGSNKEDAAQLDKLCTDMLSTGKLYVVNEYYNLSANDFQGCPAPQQFDTTTAGDFHIRLRTSNDKKQP